MSTPALFSTLAFLTVFIIFFGLQRILDSRRALIGNRLDQYASRAATISDAATGPAGSRMERGLNRMMSGSFSQRLVIELQRADIKLTPAEFVALNLAAVVIGFLLALVLGHSNFAFGLLGGVVGFYVPRLWMRRQQSKRLTMFNNQLNDTLILLANSIRSGYSLQQAMEAVARELPPPVSVEFSRVTREVSLGLNLEEALMHMLDRINSEDLDLIITAINIQHSVGGNLAEILDTIAHTVRERVRIKGQIRSMTAQQSISGKIISLLPFALAAFMFIFNQNYFKSMWEEPCGLMMLGYGIFSIFIGYLIIQQITKIEV
ncbi:MAG: type II secretion system F family protein [Chloroflexi bacterium]|nr:type II secretion system F family protein [Chloroflexota bacterium]